MTFIKPKCICWYF